MIKFKIIGQGKPIIGLGLSEMNVEKLKEGQPILIKGSMLGIDFDITIFYGKDEQTMTQELMDVGILPSDIFGGRN